MKYIALLLFAFMLAGCASFAKRLEVSTVAKIHPAQTARADVEKLLGRPKETVVSANGVTVARYFFHEFHRSTEASRQTQREHPGDVLFRTLTLKYGASDVVEQKLHDESVTPIYRTNAWFFAGPVLTPETIAFVQRGTTRENDLIARLNEPSSRTFDGQGRSMLIWFSIKTRETTWSDPAVQRFLVSMENGVVRDYLLVEHALSEFEPLVLH